MGTGARALAVHRYLFRLALMAGNVFGWVVVFRVLLFFSISIPNALAGTALLFAIAQGICFLLTPLAGSALRHGTRRALVIGSLSLAFSFAFLAELFLSRYALFVDCAFWLIAGFAVLNGIGRALYFVPYAAASAQEPGNHPHAHAREFSLALVPLCAGALAEGVGIGLLFALATAIALAAAVAVIEMTPTYERFDWSYRETFAALFSPAHRSALSLAIFDGLQGAALLLIWPLAIFLILRGSFDALGAVLTATLLFAFVARFAMRRWKGGGIIRRSPYVRATVAFSSWILRLPAGTPLQIVAADVLYQSAVDHRGRGIDASTLEQSADNGHYVDEYTALKEMGHCIGRALMCVLFAALAVSIAPIVAFAACIAAAAMAAAASVLFAHHLAREAF